MSQTGSTDFIAQIQAAIVANDLRRAALLSDKAAEAGVRDPFIFVPRALLLNAQGRATEGLALLERLDATSAPRAAVKEAIGLCCVTLGRAEDAIAAFEAAAIIEPQSSERHSRKAWGYEISGELEPAKRAYEEAVRLNPRNGRALGRLAHIAARLGAWDEARDFARRAIAIEPKQISARLAFAMADIEQGTGAAERRVNELLNDTQGPDRYIALGLLGNLRDRQGLYPAAFSAYSQSKAWIAQLHGPRLMSFGVPMYENALALRAFYERAPAFPPPALASAGEPQCRTHVFVLGFPRSGTTLLEQIFASHPDAVALGEKYLLADSVRDFLAKPDDFPRLADASPETLARYRDLYWDAAGKFGIDARGKTFVDKTPINTVRLPLIARLFPDTKIVFAVRDPRDVVLSAFRQPFDINELTREFVTLEGTARLYDAVMSLAEIYRAKLPLDVLELRLEDLIADFDGKMREVCAFTGLDWDERLRDFARVARTRGVATPSATQVVRDIDETGIGRWRHYAHELEPVMPILEPWVKRFGYSES